MSLAQHEVKVTDIFPGDTAMVEAAVNSAFQLAHNASQALATNPVHPAIATAFEQMFGQKVGSLKPGFRYAESESSNRMRRGDG